MKIQFRIGQKFQDWKLRSFLGGGGNGVVWECENLNGEIQAIKLLKIKNKKAYKRFIDEIKIIEENSEIQGLIPIIEKHLPQNFNSSPFYIMPLADESEKVLSSQGISAKIDAIIEIAITLSELHKRKIFHRDIKPANILYYHKRFCLADFGLVTYPNKNDNSAKNENIGAKWTIAPEMRRESSKANPAMADVYSLAKTLWIYLTGRKKGFDGQYSTESIIDLKKVYPTNYTTPLDDLLIKSTDNDPNKRPTVEEFILELQNWKSLNEDFHQRNLQQWFEMQTRLFPTSIPHRVAWTNNVDIVKILKTICLYNSLNHGFLPNGGGLDLIDAHLSREEGLIELDFGKIHIIKPKILLFESFNHEYHWNYFRLELDNLTPTCVNQYNDVGEYSEIRLGFEEVSELSAGNFYPNSILENRYKYDKGYLITEYSRQVTRWFKGSFVFFCKRSSYNQIRSTYDGRHNKMSNDKFRDYIQNIVTKLENLKNVGATTPVLGDSSKKKKELRHIIEEDEVYRCGWCGDIVDSEGKSLDDHDYNYYVKVLEKFGQNRVIMVKGECCSGSKESGKN